MALKIYNTLTRKKEAFKPLKGKQVRLYTCGPTVYDFAHIGNFRTYVWQDLLRRWLEFKSFKVIQVMNLTDVDDKTIKRSLQEQITLKELTDRYTKAFFEDKKTLNIKSAEFYPKATENIPGMVQLIKRLLKKKIAYKGEDGSIYFDISKFKNYGKLSKLKIKELKSGARVNVDQYEKDEAEDFALWKAWNQDDGKVFWDTEIGKGRPGWHIECSVMSMKYFGESFDIHTGGIDLMFPHHENEIAQSECATGKKFVKYWMHAEHLMVEGRKMSKSLGNFYTLRDLLEKGYDPRSIRYVLLSTNYREKLNFTFESVKTASNIIERIGRFLNRLKEVKNKKESKEVSKLLNKLKENFEKAMDDDLRINDVLAALFEFEKDINKLMDKNKIGQKNSNQIIKEILKIDEILGLKLDELLKEEKIPKEIKDLTDQREDARKRKDFQEADRIRNLVKEKGYSVEDTEKGPRVEKI